MIRSHSVMAIGCRNCGAYFTPDEIARGKPPLHAWPLTRLGQQTQDANIANQTNQAPCPRCGRLTLWA